MTATSFVNPLVAGDLVAAIRSDLGMSRVAFGTLTGRTAETIRQYEHGRRSPPAIFFHDLIEAAPECGLRFNDIARFLGYRWIESVDPAGFSSIHDFFVGVRVNGGRSRADFAVILGVSPRQIFAVEHGVKPDPALVRRNSCLMVPYTSCVRPPPMVAERSVRDNANRATRTTASQNPWGFGMLSSQNLQGFGST